MVGFSKEDFAANGTGYLLMLGELFAIVKFYCFNVLFLTYSLIGSRRELIASDTKEAVFRGNGAASLSLVFHSSRVTMAP